MTNYVLNRHAPLSWPLGRRSFGTTLPYLCSNMTPRDSPEYLRRNFRVQAVGPMFATLGRCLSNLANIGPKMADDGRSLFWLGGRRKEITPKSLRGNPGTVSERLSRGRHGGERCLRIWRVCRLLCHLHKDNFGGEPCRSRCCVLFQASAGSWRATPGRCLAYQALHVEARRACGPTQFMRPCKKLCLVSVLAAPGAAQDCRVSVVVGGWDSRSFWLRVVKTFGGLTLDDSGSLSR